MTTENSNVTDEAQIPTIIEERVKAFSNKDINALLSNHAADILSFNLINPCRLTWKRAKRRLTSSHNNL